ncbi:TonB-dependent receptor [Arcticibacter tournemirensis]|uniref:TonB-dependent receptor n=2 Tax=Arcticibacter tournemirensis TaxID=699437 RepID=A0A4V1KIW9_9SPHI|nr:TonB-dependent receptor [Arcticibacter tournemirensis]
MNNFYKMKYFKPDLLLQHVGRSALCLVLFLMIGVAPAAAQSKIITGIVKDQQGEVLPGVSVLVKGTTTGAVTDINGKYRLTVPGPKAVLSFSFVGLGTQELVVGDKAVLDVTLRDDAKSLEEVVVVGYGVQKRATLTGAINTVSSKEILQSPTSNVTNSLAGRLPGVSVIQQSGQPGLNSSTIKIRGVATYNTGNQGAIVIVDGVERNSFGDIDPNEIESISVLKDASSTAIFGIRGANGVIIVTTKAGKEGSPRISYTGNASIQTYTGIPKAVNSYDNTRLMNEARINDDLPALWTDQQLEKFKDGSDPLGYPDVNWFDYVTRKYYPQTQHNLNVSGGTKIVKYYASVGYLFEDGIFKKFDSPYGIRSTPSYNRYNFRSNLDFNFTKDLQMSVRLGGRLGKRYMPSGPTGSSFAYDNMNGMISRILQTPSFAYPVMLPDGKITGNQEVGTNVWNPYAVLTRWGTRNDDNNSIESTFDVNYKLDKLVKGLSFKGLFGYDSYYNSTARRAAWWASYLYDRETGETKLAGDSRDRDEPLGDISSSYDGSIKMNLQLGFNYSRTFGRHNLSAVLLATRQLNQFEGDGKNAAPEAVQGVVNRTTYNFGEKYFAEINMAYNGSEQFAPYTISKGKQYGFFPAASIGWTVTKEEFMKDVTWLNYLKIRGSYGKVGNDRLYKGDDKLRFLYLTEYSRVSNGVTFGIPGQQTGRPIVDILSRGNTEITWETGVKRNIGFESRFLKEKLTLNVDLFEETRSDILSERTVSRGAGLLTFGDNYPYLNVGKVKNKGYEIELNFRDRTGEFGYGINTQFSFNKNKILNADEPLYMPGYQKTEGKPVGQFFGYLTDGFFTSEEDIAEYSSRITPIGNVIPGDLKYVDYNQDGRINSDDRVPIGYSRNPEYIFSFSPNFSWKGLSLSVLLQGVANVSSDVVLTEQNNGFQIYEHQLNRWTQETAATATWPALHWKGNNYYNYQLNDFILQDASYIKLRNVEISYNFPKKWLQPLKVSSLRLFFSGQNLHTWTKFKMYLDPEALNDFNTDFSKQSIYPTSRIYNLGVNIQL